MSKPVDKAYKNSTFMSSSHARTIRILSEYLEPEARFKEKHIKDTIVFFGSARFKDSEVAKDKLEFWQKQYNENKSGEIQKELKRAKIQMKMSRYYDEARELARLMTEWSVSLKNSQHRFLVCSGGGPGIMEAANRGAMDVDGGQSIGLNISIPLEQGSNSYISSGLNFEFHYFFMRKFWFVYLAKALVVFPGGFGTMDEMFEVLTLVQTRKLQKKMPVVLYGKEYWSKLLNFQFMVDNLVIDEDDLNLFRMAETPQEAFVYLKEKLTEAFL